MEKSTDLHPSDVGDSGQWQHPLSLHPSLSHRYTRSGCDQGTTQKCALLSCLCTRTDWRAKEVREDKKRERNDFRSMSICCSFSCPLVFKSTVRRCCYAICVVTFRCISTTEVSEIEDWMNWKKSVSSLFWRWDRGSTRWQTCAWMDRSLSVEEISTGVHRWSGIPNFRLASCLRSLIRLFDHHESPNNFFLRSRRWGSMCSTHRWLARWWRDFDGHPSTQSTPGWVSSRWTRMYCDVWSSSIGSKFRRSGNELHHSCSDHPCRYKDDHIPDSSLPTRTDWQSDTVHSDRCHAEWRRSRSSEFSLSIRWDHWFCCSCSPLVMIFVLVGRCIQCDLLVGLPSASGEETVPV